MSLLDCFRRRNGSDENLNQIKEQAQTRYHGWLVMSPFEFPGQEPNTVTFSRRSWKRQFFELSLVQSRTSHDPNRFYLTCYSREDRKRPKGSVDLNTVTDLRMMSMPPQVLLETLSRKYYCDDCQLQDLSAQQQQQNPVLYCDKLPFFSFDANFGGIRGRVYLLAEDGKQMRDWVRHLSLACGQPLSVEPAAPSPSLALPAAPFPADQSKNWASETGTSKRKPSIASPPPRLQQSHPVVPVEDDTGIYNSNQDCIDDTDGDYGDLKQEDQHGNEDDAYYFDPKSLDSAKEVDETTDGIYDDSRLVSQHDNQEDDDRLPIVAPRRFLPQATMAPARNSSTDYENLKGIMVANQGVAASASDNVYGNLQNPE